MPMRQFRVPLLWLAFGYAGLVLILAWQLKRGHDLALARACDYAENLVQILDGQISSSMRRVENSLHQIAQRLPRMALRQESRSGQATEVVALLRSYQDSFPELGHFSVWDAAGRLLYTTDSEARLAPPGVIAAQDAFRTLRDDPKAGIAYAEPNDRSSTQGLAEGVYAPIRDTQGRLIGAVSAGMNARYFQQWFGRMNLAPGNFFFMRSSQDHRLLLRHPPGDPRHFYQPVRNGLQQRIDAGETAGRDRFTAVLDGTPRLYAFRKLEGYPFYVVVGVSEREALRDWVDDFIFIVVAVVLLATLSGFLLLRMRAIQLQRLAARRQADEALALLRDALDSIAVGIVIYDAQDRLVMSNRAVQDLYTEIHGLSMRPGMSFEEIIRSGLELKLFPDAIGREEAWLAERLEERRRTRGESREHRLSDGRWVQYSEHRTSRGYMVGSRIDITDRKQLEGELREQASTDALTGLANRRHFMQGLESELERVRRQTTQRACVLMLDLDHFKRVNDRHGHAAGDSLLRHFAELLRGEMRGTDMAGRLGGEEFGVILPGSGPDEARAWAQRLCDALSARPLVWGTQRIQATVSVGIAILGPDEGAADAALSRADAALYRAKEKGRNRVELA